MLRITSGRRKPLRYAPAVRRAEALEQIERSMGRIGRAGSSVMAARRRADRAGVDVSAPGMGVLGVLERGGAQRVSVLARRAGMVAPLASRELRHLEQQGFVTRAADGADGRAVVVAITPKGRDAYRRLRAAAVAAASDALAGWKATELAELARLLARMADDFERGTPMSVTGRRVAVVTGVGPGIGRSTALALAGDECDVVVAARRADYLDEMVRELETLGVGALAVPTDTGDVAQCRALVEHAVDHFGRLDVVVSSAAKGTPNHTILNSDLADWEQSWLVNVLGPLELFRSAVPHLVTAGGGAIVVVSTLAVRAINAGQGAYAATKAALTVAAQTLAREVGVDGIRVNAVVPGFVPGPNTETMFERIAARRGTTVEVVQEEMAADTALRRLPTPDDVADAIVFLASARARSITGQTLDVNGGRWMT